MRTIVRVIESVSEWTGRVIRWACLALVLVLAYETTARYVFNAPTLWAYEISTMLGVTIAVLGWAYVYRHHGHVRVDVFYTHLSPRGKAIIDVVFSLIFLFPLFIVFTYASTMRLWFSWSIGEKLIESGWLIPAAPIRAVMVLGLSLFVFQGVAQFIRDLYLLVKGEPYD